MKIKRCENGHYYDMDKYAKCPHCEEFALEKMIPKRFRDLGDVCLIGRGSTCCVYKIDAETPLVLKAIDCGTDKSKYSYAIYERRIMQCVRNCSGAVALIDYDEIEENGAHTVFMLEKYYEPLETYLDHSEVNLDRVFEIVVSLCASVQQLIDCGVFHLDLKPKNIFLERGNGIKVGDFGSSLFARDLEDNRFMRGTLEYMAPEVYREHKCSERSEIYSIGLILYYLLNDRKLPFFEDKGERNADIYKRLAGTELPEIAILPPESTAEMPIHIVDSLNDVLRRCCAFNMEQRFSSVNEFKTKLEELRLAASQLPLDFSLIHSRSSNEPDSKTVPLDVSGGSDSGEFSLVQPWSSSVPINDDAERHAAMLTDQVLPDDVCDFDRRTWSIMLPPSDYEANLLRAIEQKQRSKDTEPAGPLSEVEFSAIAPKHMVKGEYAIIDVVMYEKSFRHIVDEICRQADVPMQEKRAGVIDISSGSHIKVVLCSPDIKIKDNERDGVWKNAYLDFSFPVYLPKHYRKRQVLFTAYVYKDDVILTRISFAARRLSFFRQNLSVSRNDVLSAFVSYASQDRRTAAIVVQGIQKARPDMNVFFDVESLRSGDHWEEKLYREIDRRDVLYLCWSHFAKESVWVDREWRYALRQKGLNCIEPVPLELPEHCPPPEELKEKHFNDRLLFMIEYLNHNENE